MIGQGQARVVDSEFKAERSWMADERSQKIHQFLDCRPARCGRIHGRHDGRVDNVGIQVNPKPTQFLARSGGCEPFEGCRRNLGHAAITEHSTGNVENRRRGKRRMTVPWLGSVAATDQNDILAPCTRGSLPESRAKGVSPRPTARARHMLATEPV